MTRSTVDWAVILVGIALFLGSAGLAGASIARGGGGALYLGSFGLLAGGAVAYWYVDDESRVWTGHDRGELVTNPRRTVIGCHCPPSAEVRNR